MQIETSTPTPAKGATPHGWNAPLPSVGPGASSCPLSPPQADIGSYVARKITDPSTLSLLVRATEQAVAAVQSMIQEAAGDPETLRTTLDRYVDLVFGHEVAFLFPNLEPDERDLLVALLKTRNTIGVHLNGLPQSRNPDDRAAHARMTQSLQTEFARLCRRLEASGLEHRLDHVQRRVLRDEFLSILLDKSSSTQLFFRRGAHASPRENRNPATALTPVAPPQATKRILFLRDDEGLGQPGPVAPAQATKRILFLGNHETEAKGIACWLGTAGYEILIGTAGLEGCRLVLQQKPDLILLDLTSVTANRPCESLLDSRTILQILSRLLHGWSVPVIGLASAADFEAQDQLTRAGASACLRRPLDPHALLAAVQNAFQKLSPAHPGHQSELTLQAA
jgi:CheY-like chemotaxis protein